MLGIGDDPCTACCKVFAKFMASWSETPVFADTNTQEEFVGGTGGCTSVVTFTSWRTRSTWPAIASRFSTLNFIVDRSTTSFKAFTKSTTTQSESPDCRGHDLHNLRKTARSPSTVTARLSLGRAGGVARGASEAQGSKVYIHNTDKQRSHKEIQGKKRRSGVF